MFHGEIPEPNGHHPTHDQLSSGNGYNPSTKEASSEQFNKPQLSISDNLGVGQYLQGVQHFGITVNDMNKSLEFYTEVLGGKLAIGGDGFVGDVLHNTLFQKEEIEAINKGIDPQELGVPDIRDGSKQALDVRFLSFGNTCVELIHFREASLTSAAPNYFESVPTSVGYGNVPHLSFNVKDDVDLNLFAKLLEYECDRRGIKIICNRIIKVRSEAERKLVALKYNANKFWNDPDYFVEGYSDSEFGDFHGWSLFYAKGPNGEQLEFNQVTRKAKQEFLRAQKEYNQANGTNYLANSISFADIISSQAVTTNNNTVLNQQEKTMMNRMPGELTDIVKRMFEAGESMNVENFVKFYSDDALYQFSNFPITYGPQGIRDSSVDFLNTVKSVYHHIKNIWEVGADTVICQMDVTYIRKDGKVFTLPCCDTIRFKGDKVQELRIYMDITPVFS